jgi:type IV secretory pathway TrbL component
MNDRENTIQSNDLLVAEINRNSINNLLREIERFKNRKKRPISFVEKAVFPFSALTVFLSLLLVMIFRIYPISSLKILGDCIYLVLGLMCFSSVTALLYYTIKVLLKPFKGLTKIGTFGN